MTRVYVPLDGDVLDAIVEDPTVAFVVFVGDGNAGKFHLIDLDHLRPWVARRIVAGVSFETASLGRLTVLVFGPRRPHRTVLARLRVDVVDGAVDVVAEAMTPAASVGEAHA